MTVRERAFMPKSQMISPLRQKRHNRLTQPGLWLFGIVLIALISVPLFVLRSTV